MIIYFKVGNYKSIKDTVTLNFNASSISELADSNIIETDKLSLLKSMVLYGHNASGKSKILDALKFLKWFTLNSATVGMQPTTTTPFEPFSLNIEYKNKPSFFEISFILNEIKYRYGFEASKTEILKEWLLESKAEKEYPVFLRIKQEFEIENKRFKNAKELGIRTRNNVLFLSVAAQWNNEKAISIINFFNNIFIVSNMDDREQRELTLAQFHERKSLVLKFLQIADLGINELEVFNMYFDNLDNLEQAINNILPTSATENEKISYANEIIEKYSKTIVTKHNIYNTKNEVIGQEDFFLETDESLGTKKYFNLIGLIISGIRENRFIVVDEFGSSFHTLLSKAILKLFNSSKIKSTAQLLVASHDTALLDNNILRRDQIYFIEKDKYGATQATSLVEYKSHRKDSPIDKNYLEGKFGAIPFIDDLEKLFEDGKN